MRYCILLISIYFIACTNNHEQVQESKDSVNITSNKSVVTDTTTIINFNDIEVVIGQTFGEYSKVLVSNDSAYISNEDLGNEPEGKLITINTSGFEDILIMQRYETSIGLNNEGPHCDLRNWKHGYSSWKEIKKLSNNLFQIDSLEQSSIDFPSYDKNELKKVIEKECGIEWVEILEQNRSQGELAGIISSIQFKIIAKSKKNGNSVERIVVVEIPMGC